MVLDLCWRTHLVKTANAYFLMSYILGTVRQSRMTQSRNDNLYIQLTYHNSKRGQVSREVGGGGGKWSYRKVEDIYDNHCLSGLARFENCFRAYVFLVWPLITFQHDVKDPREIVWGWKQKCEIEFLVVLSGFWAETCWLSVWTVTQAAGQTTRNTLLEKPDGMGMGGRGGVADELRMELFQISKLPLLLSFLEKFTFFPCKSTSAPCFSLKYT